MQAYSVPEGGHNCAPAHMGKRELLSDFIPPFTAGFEAGAQAVMVCLALSPTPIYPHTGNCVRCRCSVS